MDNNYETITMLYNVIVCNSEHKAPIKEEIKEHRKKIDAYIHSIANDNIEAENISDRLFALYVPIIDLYGLDSFAKGILFSRNIKTELEAFNTMEYYYD